jgi:hypothetical protein
MIDVIIRGSFGEFGSAILDFYIQYAFWINGIILVYALILVIAKRGYSVIKDTVLQKVIQQHGETVLSKNENNFRRAMDRMGFDWDSLSKQTKSPIFSAGKSLLFKIKSPENLKSHFTPEKIYSLIKEVKEKSPGEGNPL